jgi:hypothetical protein
MRSIALVLALALLAVSTSVSADDIDDYVAEMKKIEEKNRKAKKPLNDIDKILAKRFPEYVFRSFAGEFNHVNYKKLADKKWEVPGKPYGTPGTWDQRGVQIRGHWSSGKKGAPADQVTCVVVSFELGKPVAFESLKRKVDPKDQKALLRAYYEISMKGLAPVPEPAEGEDPKKPSEERKIALADRKKCQEPKKKKFGKVTQWFAATQGFVTAKGRRERRAWYSWSDKKRRATYVLFARTHETALRSPEAMKKADSFAKAISKGD